MLNSMELPNMISFIEKVQNFMDHASEILHCIVTLLLNCRLSGMMS